MMARDLPSRPYWKDASGTCPGAVEKAGYVWLKFRALQKSPGRGWCPGGSINGVGRVGEGWHLLFGHLGKGHGRVPPLWLEELNGLEASKKVQSLRPMGPPRTYFSYKPLGVCYFSPATLQCKTWSKQKCAVNILTLIWIRAGGTADWSSP